MSRPPIQCALLGVSYTNWFEDMLFACDDVRLFELSAEDIGLPEAQNPYGLPRTHGIDVAIVTTNWYRWLESSHPREVESVFARTRELARAVVAFEGYDGFDLGLPPSGFDAVDLVIKAQGLYRDRERCNRRGGALFPGGHAGSEPRAAEERYTTQQLRKLRLSLPCFLGVDRRVRARVRRAKPDISKPSARARRIGDLALETVVGAQARLQRPRRLIHCVGALTHISRLDLMQTLQRTQASGDQRITRIPEYVYGTEHLDRPIPRSLRLTWEEELRRAGLLGRPAPRASYRRAMPAHKAILAPTGYGELTFRHAEAWLSGRALISPDVSYAETMYPFRDRHNVIFCSPDWSDLPEILTALDRDTDLAASIGRAGRDDWRRWSADYRQLLKAGISDHLREALGEPPVTATP